MKTANLSQVQQVKLNKLAGDIIEKNQYLSLATVDAKGNPWISPVCYTYDNKGNLYFVSVLSSRHCQNGKLNKNVAYSIFDSRQEWGKGVGLQIEGVVKELTFKDSVIPGKLYIKRDYPFGGIKIKIIFEFLNELLTNKKIYRFYKLTPKTIWMNNPYSKVDERVKVEVN